MTIDRSSAPARLQVVLPRGSRQGREGQFFTFRLIARIRLRADASGSARVLATTNGRGVNLVSLTARGGSVRMFYSGYLGGAVIKTAPAGSELVVDYENYAQLSGIRGGVNVVQVVVDEDDGDVVQQVTLLRGTALHRTSIPYDQLRLTSVTGVKSEVGQQFAIPYRLTRRGERPDRPVDVRIESAGGPLTVNTATRRFGRVLTGVDGTITGLASAPGAYQVKVTAEGGYNEPYRIIDVNIVPAGGHDWTWRASAAGVVLLLTALVVLADRRRRRGAASAAAAGSVSS